MVNKKGLHDLHQPTCPNDLKSHGAADNHQNKKAFNRPFYFQLSGLCSILGRYFSMLDKPQPALQCAII